MFALWIHLVSPAFADGTFQQLHSEAARASSFLKSNWNKYSENYHPNYILDNNPVTAWVEGASGQGEGEVLSWDVSSLSSARAIRVRIRNGYQKSAGLFAANSVPKAVRLQVWYGTGVVAEKEVTLEKKMGWQEVEIPTHGQGLDHIELTVLSVYPGSKYADTCISDIETLVDSDIAYNAAYEQSKHARLTEWISERVQTAAYFASLPPTWPWVATRFEHTHTDVDAGTVEAETAPLRAASNAMGDTGPWFRSAAKGRAPALPDGIYGLDALAHLIRIDQLAFFETPDRETTEVDRSGVEVIQTETRRHFQLQRRDGAIHRIRFSHTIVVDGRGIRTKREEFLLEYDPQGRLQTAWISVLNELDFEETVEKRYNFRWDDHQIAAVTAHTVLDRSLGPGSSLGPRYFRTEYTPAP